MRNEKHLSMSDSTVEAACPGAAQAWFGDAFDCLHPTLQQLHSGGGILEGVISIETGRGVAGMVVRRIAARLGVPVAHEQCRFEVHISHDPHRMVWARRFLLPDGSARQLTSIFTPHGSYLDGYRSETTGAMTLELGVKITGAGGWQWRPRRASLMGIPVPLRLFPASHASKQIENGQYRFQVAFSMPVLGRLLEYGGLLTPVFASPA